MADLECLGINYPGLPFPTFDGRFGMLRYKLSRVAMVSIYNFVWKNHLKMTKKLLMQPGGGLAHF